MLVICLLNNIVLRGRGFCTSSIAQITRNVPRLLADIVVIFVSNFTAATAATMHKICTFKIFRYLQSGLYQRVIGLG